MAAALGLIGLLVAVAIVVATGGADGTTVVEALPTAGDSTLASTDAAGATGTELVVDVAGAVARPGVYRLAGGSRVADAITAAGGYGPRVDAAAVPGALNLAAPLSDGQQVVVPSRDTSAVGAGSGTSSGAGSPTGAGSSGGLVDINHASQAELEALPGIGPVSAGKIIASRDGQPFTKVDELRTRKLLGQKAFDGLRDMVTVR